MYNNKVLYKSNEVTAEILGININTSTGIISIPINYFDYDTSDNARLGKFQYSPDGDASWYDCTLVNESSFTTIQSSSSPRNLILKWNAAEDLGCAETFSNLSVRITFYDSVSGGSETTAITKTIPYIDFRPGKDSRWTSSKIIDDTYRSSVDIWGSVLQPNYSDTNLSALFYNPKALNQVRLHFIYEVATDKHFNNIVLSKSTTTTTDNWTSDSNPFPEDGVQGTVKHLIEWSGYSDVSYDTLYSRIRVIPTQASYIEEEEPPPVTHNLDFKPFVWFRSKLDSTIITVPSFKVTHITDNKFSVDYYDSVASNYIIMVDNDEPETTIVDGVSSVTVNHGLDTYPYVWFVNNEDVQQSASQYSVKYVDSDGNPSSNHFTVNFYETVSNMTVCYGLGNTGTLYSEDITTEHFTLDHNLDSYIFCWAKDLDETLLTPMQFKVEYDSLNSADINFYEF